MKFPWKTTGLCVSLCAIIVVLIFILLSRPETKDDPARPAAVVTTDTGPTIERIVALSSLTTLKIDVADVVESELLGKTGKIRAVVVVKGSVALGVDLAQARFDAVDRDKHRAVIQLPQPSLQYVKLDHEHTKIVGLWSSGLWVIVPGGGDADAVAVDRGYREAERLVGEVAHDPALVRRCRAQTEEVLRSFLGVLGWTVEIR